MLIKNMKMYTWSSHFIFRLTNTVVNIYIKQIDNKNKWIFALILKLAEMTKGKNDSQPKQPTKIGRIDSPKNKAKTTRSQRPMAKMIWIPLHSNLCNNKVK